MTSQDNHSKTAADLRHKAEALARQRAERAPHDSAALSPEEIRKALHELRVHQIELEMQNEALRTAQVEIEAGRARYFDLYDLAPVGYCTLSEKGLILEANLTAATLLGKDRGTLVKQPISRFILKDDQDIYYLNRKKLFETGEPQECELRLVKPDGASFWAHLTGTLAQAKDDAPICRVVLSDITKQKKTEDNILKLTGRLNLALTSARAGVWDWNLKTNEMIWDDRMLELYGLTRENFPGGVEAWEQGLHSDDSARAIEECRAALRGELDFDTEFRVRRHDGTMIHIKANGLVQRDKEGNPVRMIGLNTDITEIKRTEESLRESEEQFRNLVETISDVIFKVDAQGTATYVSPSGLKIWGGAMSDVVGKNFLELVHPDDHEQLLKRFVELQQGIEKPMIYRFVDRSGRLLWGRSHSTPIWKNGCFAGACGTLMDITVQKEAEAEKEKLQEKLLQAQKMESVGRLAGGVAHDFNNMLSVIIGNAELAMENMAPDDPLHNNLSEIFSASQRSADITRQLLAFARKQTIAPKVLDLNRTIKSMLKMLRRLIGEDIDLAWLPETTIWPVRMDPSQIDQILVNLCVNARDAIADVGKITIETETATFDSAYCAEHPGFVAGDFVLLAVSDNGHGMDSETMSHLFEPFFTTKELGKGTGLGLATVYGIVKQNDGFINVYSEPGQGTTFRIYLPRHLTGTESLEKKTSDKTHPDGTETILLVEDEPSILNMTRMMLERMGYKVLAAGTPGEAIALAREHVGGIHLLMTDVVMPEMNGRDLAKNLLSLYPNLKRLFMSGYTADVIAHHGVLDEGVQFIQKPFSREQLGIKVKEALDEDNL